MPLSPRTRERLVYHLDRPLGFYLTLLIAGLIAASAYGAHSGNTRPDKWPTWLVTCLVFVGVIAAVCVGIIVIWLIRSAFWLLFRQVHRLRTRRRPTDL